MRVVAGVSPQVSVEEGKAEGGGGAGAGGGEEEAEEAVPVVVSTTKPAPIQFPGELTVVMQIDCGTFHTGEHRPIITTL